MAPVAFSPENQGKEAALLVAMTEETKEAYKREKASLVGFQGSFTKKETVWREAVEAWQTDPLSKPGREVAVELRIAAKEAKARLDTALYSIITYGVVVDAYQDFMESVEDRYQTINETFMNLSTAYKIHLMEMEAQKLQIVKDAMGDRIREQEHTDLMETNRADRKTRLMELELRVIRERADAEALARANPPAPAQPVPAPAHPGPAAAAAAPQRRYREVSTLHPGALCLENSPEELRIFKNSFRNWYQISCLDTLDAEQQIFTLKKCCNLPLQQKINWELPTIEDALQALTAVWETEYPYVLRRLEFLRNKQLQTENYEEFVLRAKQLFVNGNIARMTPFQLQKLNIISGLRDSKLQIKLLALPPDATLADTDATWQAYTANIATSSKLGSSGSEVHKAQGVGNDSNPTCWKCGKNGHLKFDCRALSKDIYCAKCKVNGSHVTSTCRENEGRTRSYSRGRDTSRGRDRDTSRGRDRDTSRGRDRYRKDSRGRRDSRGRTPGRTDRSDSRRRSNNQNDKHRARSVSTHKDTLGQEIVNRITTRGVDDCVDIPVDEMEYVQLNEN